MECLLTTEEVRDCQDRTSHSQAIWSHAAN